MRYSLGQVQDDRLDCLLCVLFINTRSCFHCGTIIWGQSVYIEAPAVPSLEDNGSDHAKNRKTSLGLKHDKIAGA